MAKDFFIIACQHATHAERNTVYHYSVRLSICHAVVLYLTEFISSNFVHRDIGAYHSFFQSQSHFTKFQRDPRQRGRKIPGSGKTLRFSIGIAVYLGNGLR